MKAAHKKVLKAQGRSEKDLKAIDSVTRRAKDLFGDCNDLGIRVLMAGNKVRLIVGEVDLVAIDYPK
jgi:hypothetical protein